MPAKADRRSALTLEKLASYDDVITDALVDKIYYWTAIRKNRGGRFTASRGLHEEDISDIVRKYIIWEKDPAEAVQKLLQLPGLRKFMAGLGDERDQEHFRRHLRRYVNIYMPDCPFEVTTTNRYTITDHEASVTARRDINAREEIKYLTGVQVAMTEEQEKSLELARKDFSLVISSRKKTRSLFLGPARFANHDCDANAKLTTVGHEGMRIVAVKPINQGEEITVSYGDDYFGDDNEECLCQTCEDRMQNGWAPMRKVEDSDDEEEEEEASETSRKRRRKDAADENAPVDSEPVLKRARVEQQTTTLLKTTLTKARSASSLRQEVPVSSIEDPTTNLSSSPNVSREIRTQQRDGLLTVGLDETSSSRDISPQSPLTAASPKSSQSTDATSIDEDLPANGSPAKIKLEPSTLHLESPTLGVATVQSSITTTTVTGLWPSPPVEDDRQSDLSELSSSYDLDSDTEQVIKRKPRPTTRTTRSKSRFDIANRVGTPVSAAPDLDTEYTENPRKPGDYMTSASLLSAKYSKWVECQTCDTRFVQQDGYLTRKECPRCERHSKLYGFPWPKTDRDGKNDKEVRIKDHRTVHRFVDPDEERQLRRERANKGLKEQIRERFSTPRSGRDSMSASVEVESGRRRRRVRQTM